MKDAPASSGFSRRDMLAASGAVAVPLLLGLDQASALTTQWNAGEIAHLIPSVSHDQLLLKASLRSPTTRPVTLSVNGRSFEGRRSDREGRYWRFLVSGLAPNSALELQLRADDKPLCDPWPLRTMPAPDAQVAHFRLLSISCAGGDPAIFGPGGIEVFRPMEIRQRLLARALSFKPQVLIANGDQIYWDQQTWLNSRNPKVSAGTRALYNRFGNFDRMLPLLGTANEDIIKRLGERQIAALYGTSLRSVPSYFVSDDHDYFENDEAEERFVTFPPDRFSMEGKRAVQTLFYPEFLPDPNRPLGLSGTRTDGLSECFGTLRVGRLFEALIYDCGGYLTLKGSVAGLVPPEVEDWLIARTRASDVGQLLHVPSHPPGWSAGKWREWYPDVVVDSSASRVTAEGTAITDFAGAGNGKGRLSTERRKNMWQEGWHRQHQRLMAALSAQPNRGAAILSGDLHATGALRLTRSGDLDLAANPVHIMLSGTLGSSTASWPSAVRGVAPQPASSLAAEALAKMTERNGFTLVDVTPDRMVFRLFAWREPQPLSDIDTLEPYATVNVPRPNPAKP